MSTYFTIGEIANMYNLSIQTLRHYDKIGLLSPAYTNPKTGYRYYSIQQFVKIDFIKHGKALGMTLDEIKVLIKKLPHAHEGVFYDLKNSPLLKQK